MEMYAQAATWFSEQRRVQVANEWRLPKKVARHASLFFILPSLILTMLYVVSVTATGYSISWGEFVLALMFSTFYVGMVQFTHILKCDLFWSVIDAVLVPICYMVLVFMIFSSLAFVLLALSHEPIALEPRHLAQVAFFTFNMAWMTYVFVVLFTMLRNMTGAYNRWGEPQGLSKTYSSLMNRKEPRVPTP